MTDDNYMGVDSKRQKVIVFSWPNSRNPNDFNGAVSHPRRLNRTEPAGRKSSALMRKDAERMTRRERHIRILERFGRDRVRFHREEVIARRGLSAFTDDAIEDIARRLVASHRRQQKWNREYREQRKATA